jgi:hypothetical protein
MVSTSTIGDTTASLCGYAKLDMIYDVDNDLGDLVACRVRRLIGLCHAASA